MTKKFWLTITNMENWGVIKDNLVYAFNENNKKNFDEINVGDFIVMYVTPKKFGGLFEVSSKFVKDKIRFNGDSYLHQIKLKKILIPKHETDVNEKIVQNISIFKNSLRWGTILFGRSIKKITKEDFEYIKDLMGK